MEIMRRQTWIDIAKGVGILLIVYGHVQGEWSVFHSFAASFSVIVFLVLSGWLFSTKDAKYSTKKLVDKILKPYLVFSLMAIVVKLIYDLCTGEAALTNALWDIYKTVVGYGIGAIWYLSSYLIACLIFFRCRRAKSTKLGMGVVLSGIIVGAVVGYGLLWLQQRLGQTTYQIIYYPVVALFRGLACASFIGAGWILERLVRRVKKRGELWLAVGGVGCLAAAVLLSFICTEAVTGYVNFSFLRLGARPELFVLRAMVGSIGIMWLCYFVNKFFKLRWLQYCGRNSLIIMGTHMSLMLYVLATKLLNFGEFKLGVDLPNIIYGFLGVGIVMLLEIPVIHLLNGRLSWMITTKSADVKQGAAEEHFDLKKIDFSISLVRFIAMGLIILCHILQGFLHSEWAFWANVGVQMFLLISGILYGSRTTIAKEPVKFWLKTFRKILVKYYIYVLIIVAVLILTKTANLGMSAYSILPWIKFQPTATGYEHIWFIKCILACYLLTPAWCAVLNAMKKDRTSVYLLKMVGIFLVNDFIFRNFIVGIDPAWANCFLLGMILTRVKSERSAKVYGRIIAALVVAAVVANAMQICLSYVINVPFSERTLRILQSFYNYAHVLLGLVLVLSIRGVYNLWLAKRRLKALKSLLLWSDRMSFDVFFMHTLFIPGAFNMMHYVASPWVAGALATIWSVIAAYPLHYLTILVDALISRIGRKFVRRTR